MAATTRAQTEPDVGPPPQRRGRRRQREKYNRRASLLVTLPMMVIFAFGQRYFIEGVATAGLKG